MSVEYEDYCVGCPPDLPCLGAACMYHGKFPVFYCDRCGEEAEYHIEKEDLCEDCAKERMKEIFADLSLQDMAESLEAYVTLDKAGDDSYFYDEDA